MAKHRFKGRLVNLLNRYPDKTPPFEDKVFLKFVHRKVGYPQYVSLPKVSKALTDSYEKMHKGQPVQKAKKIPRKTWKGLTHSTNPKDIAQLDTYQFKAEIVKQVYSHPDLYEDFVARYVEIAVKRKYVRRFVPSKHELEAFKKFQNKTIDFTEFGKMLGKQSQEAAQKLGRIYNYVQSNAL